MLYPLCQEISLTSLKSISFSDQGFVDNLVIATLYCWWNFWAMNHTTDHRGLSHLLPSSHHLLFFSVHSKKNHSLPRYVRQYLGEHIIYCQNWDTFASGVLLQMNLGRTAGVSLDCCKQTRMYVYLTYKKIQMPEANHQGGIDSL